MKKITGWSKKLRSESRRFAVVSLLLITTVFGVVLFVSADDNATEGNGGPEMQLGTEGIVRGSNICIGDISKGNYSGYPLKWTVLDPDKDNSGIPGAMFLFSKGVVGEKDKKGNPQPFRYYNGWWNPFKHLINNKWHHSSMPDWCEAFTKTVFTPAEQKAIRPVTKVDIPTQSIGPFKDKVLDVDPDGHVIGWKYLNYDLLIKKDKIKEQKVLFPAYDEIKNEDAYATMPGWGTTRYWLRAPGELYPIYDMLTLVGSYVGIYTTHAEHKDYGKSHSPAFEYEDITQKCMARPVMNLEKASVIFSNVAGAKGAADLGEMRKLDQDLESRDDWELSLEDPAKRDFDAELIQIHVDSGEGYRTAEVKVSGAQTGMCDYISAIAMDGDRNILYYGRIAKSIGETYNYRIPITWDVNDTDIDLYVFNEMYEDKEKTSLISPLRYIDIHDEEKGIHVVSFDLNGHGSPQPEWQEVEKDEKATKPEDPFAVGYDFRGWFTEPEAETQWDFDDVVTTNMTLYAGWSVHEYTIKYDANGGGGTMEDQQRYYRDGEAVKECEFSPPDENRKFTGWNRSPDGSGEYHYPGETDDLTFNDDDEITLYAQWSDELMVAYHLNGHGSPLPDTEVTGADKGWKITKPEDPTDKSYAFDGWYTTPVCEGEAWDFENDSLENNTTLFAKWKPNTYTVHFVKNEDKLRELNREIPGGEMDDQHRECGDNVPIKNEYTLRYGSTVYFVEWNTDPDGGGISYEDGYIGDLCEEDGDEITLYAIWGENLLYTVAFDANEGSGEMEDQNRDWHDGKKLSRNTFTRDGFAFTGWNDKADGTGRHYDDETTEDIINIDCYVKLYAQWVNDYTVHFDSNGGSGKMDDEARSIGDGKALPANRYKREGREFAGWNTERDGSGTFYEDGFEGDLKVDGSEITLYAQWDVDYIISYDANGGNGNMQDQMRTFDDGKNLAPNEFSKEGHLFDCWNTEPDGTGIEYADGAYGDLSNRACTIVLYAQWKPETVYTITFDANGGSFEDGSDKHSRKTDVYGVLDEFESDPGPNAFYGWYSAPNGGVKVAPGARFTWDTTLYASWTKPKEDLDWDSFDFTGPFEITYDPNGDGATVDPTTQWTREGSQTMNPPNKNRVYIYSHPTPKWEAHGFLGWYTNPKGGTLAVEGIDENASPPPAHYMSDTKLYAHWRTLEYNVRFNSNGGQGTMPDQHRIFDDGVGLSPNLFVRSDYKFNGWNTEINGSGESFEDGYLGNMTDKEETIVLYAQWKKKNYIVNFDMNGKDGNPKPAPYPTGPEKDYKAEKPAKDPELEGYSFDGWYKEPECVNEWDFDNDIVVEESTTLYAKWTGNIEFIEGMNSSWTKGSQADLRFRTNGPIEMFESIEIDGKQIRPSTDYTASEGSTIITLKPAYLGSLETGSHSITALYNDGQRPFTAFTVAEKPDEDITPDRNDSPDKDDAPDKNDSPDRDKNGDDKGHGNRTAGGDTSDSTDLAMLLMATLMILGSLAACISIFVRSKVR